MKLCAVAIAAMMLSVAFDVCSCSREGSSRSERSIREWFSGIMKRFQKKEESRPEAFYLRPAYPSFHQSGYNGPSGHYGGGGGSQFSSHQTNFGHYSGFGGSQGGHGGGGHVGGHQGGHGGGHSFGGHGGAGTGSGGFGGGHGQGNNAGFRGVKQNIPHGFGPLKNSDVIKFGGQAASHSHGEVHQNIHDSHSISESSFEVSAPQSEAFVSHHSEPIDGDIDDVTSYAPPSNSIVQISPVDDQYISPSSDQLPLEQKSDDLSFESDYALPLPSSTRYQVSTPGSSKSFSVPHSGGFSSGSGSSDSHIVVGGDSSESYFAPQLGPDDPIIEIVFQDGEPVPPPPPPVIDESLYAPASDDVEVYFIEYSPEDNLDDLKNLDLSGAQPAILQNLPTELPYELRNHLVNSGVLQNADIEIIDLDRALNDQSLDVNTRNALRQAYSRTNRQVASSNEISNVRTIRNDNSRNVDIRVQHLNHGSNTPEGVLEFLKGLEPFRKGKFAGVVEVNDQRSEKYLPLSIDGDKLPVPDNIPLENKKVDGVLVFADKNRRQPKSNFSEGKSLQLSPSDLKSSATNEEDQKKKLNINWADMDTNGWIPIVNS